MSEIEKIHIELISLNDTKEFLTNCKDEFTSIEDRYYAVTAQLKDIIRQHSIEKDNVNQNQIAFERVEDDAKQSEQHGPQIQSLRNPHTQIQYGPQTTQLNVNSGNLPSPASFNNQLTIHKTPGQPSSSSNSDHYTTSHVINHSMSDP